MKTTFLGHGIGTNVKPNVGKQLTDSFSCDKFNSFNGFVAFATGSGVKSIIKSIENSNHIFNQCRFFIGIDNRVTSEEALRLLLKKNVETFIYYDSIKVNSIYHPKLYIFEGRDNYRVIIGSSNLTYQALNSNLEASIQLDFDSENKEGNSLLKEIKGYYSSLLDLSSKNIKQLTEEYLQELIEKNLLSKKIEIDEEEEESKSSNQNNLRKDYEKRFTETDSQQFNTLFNRYLEYKEIERPDGIVSKHTEDEELLKWYQKMHSLYNQGTNAFPFKIFETLLNADFPFDGIGRIRKHLIDWNIDFQKMLDYKMKFASDKDYIHIPQFKDPSNKYFRVGQWCAHQKQRRKGNKNYGMDWLPYEEDKMNSVNFVWDLSTLGQRIDDDNWMDNLAEVEEYYSNPRNYKTVPSQKEYIGHWLSDQMSFKTKQDRENRDDLLSEDRVEILGNLLSQNGVEWEFKKQQHRESIEEGIKKWKELTAWENNLGNKKPTKEERAYYKPIKGWIASIRNRSKKWKEKDLWKKEMLMKEGFPLPENEKKPAPNTVYSK